MISVAKILKSVALLSALCMGVASCSENMGQLIPDEIGTSYAELIRGDWEYDYSECYFQGKKLDLKGTLYNVHHAIAITDYYYAYVDGESNPVTDFDFNSAISRITLNRPFYLKDVDDKTMVLIENPVSYACDHIQELPDLESMPRAYYNDMIVYGGICQTAPGNILGTDFMLWGWYQNGNDYVPCGFTLDIDNNVIAIFDEAVHYYKRISSGGSF